MIRGSWLGGIGLPPRSYTFLLFTIKTAKCCNAINCVTCLLAKGEASALVYFQRATIELEEPEETCMLYLIGYTRS